MCKLILIFIWITTRKWVKRVSLFSIFILEFYRAPSLGELVKKVHILHVNTHLWARKWLRSFLFVLKSTAIIFRSRLEFQLKHSPWIFFNLVSLRSSRSSWTFGNNIWEQPFGNNVWEHRLGTPFGNNSLDKGAFNNYMDKMRGGGP